MKIILLQDEPYHVISFLREEKFAILATNLKVFWKSVLLEKQLLKSFKEENSLIKCSDDWILKFFNTILDNDAKLDIIGNNMSLKIEGRAGGMKIKFSFLLKEQSTEEFYSEITSPLVTLINGLTFVQNKLVTAIKQKDLEINEYKLEGADITRKNVTTERFDENIFLKKSIDEYLGKINGLETKLNDNQTLNNLFSEASSLALIKNKNIKKEKEEVIIEKKEEQSPTKGVPLKRVITDEECSKPLISKKPKKKYVL